MIIITRDEEEQIGRALESVRWADEIVVVDSGSTDRTVEIARGYTDRVVVRPWEGYGAQKQHALELATCEWVLSLDADEEVTEGLREGIQRAISAPQGSVGFRVRIDTWYLGEWFGSRGWRRLRRLRLFRREGARYNDAEVHESVRLAGKIGRVDGVLRHYHFRSFEHEISKLNRYSTVGARQRFERGQRAGMAQPVLRGFTYFAKQYVLHGGFLHGGVGLVEGSMGGIYGFLIYAKLWELSRAEREAR